MNSARISLNNGATFIDPAKLPHEEAMELFESHAIDALLDSEISEALHGEPDPNEWLVRYASAFKSKHGAWPVMLG